jgi:hypothetical protein
MSEIIIDLVASHARLRSEVVNVNIAERWSSGREEVAVLAIETASS